ncbi:MAG: hypothetical protein U0414_42325 [Polyangiaceae bacterium]
MLHPPHTTARTALAVGLAAAAIGCGTVPPPTVARPAKANEWFIRAQEDFSSAKVEEAHDAIQKALSFPQDATNPRDWDDVHTLAANIALARLDFAESLRQLLDVPGSEAEGLRGRAYWYEGSLGPAADSFDKMLDDPKVRDPWAKQIALLARRGEGRTPFAISGGIVAAVEMAHVSPAAPYLVIPVEIDGAEGLAMVQTSTAEVVIDAPGKTDPSWVSMRFGHRLEVSDVPALAQDLSGVSKELGVPIKALIGMSLIRHLNATVDYRGRQFVARAYAPPPPPNATRVSLFYMRGGGMFLSTPLGTGEGSQAALFVDSSMRFPLALDENGWQKAGLKVDELKLVPGDPEKKMREGVVPSMKLGAFDVSHVPGVFGGVPIEEMEKGLNLKIDGVIGSALLAAYRITFSDGGRMMWIEDDTLMHEIDDMEVSPFGPLDEADLPGAPILGAPTEGGSVPPANP